MGDSGIKQIDDQGITECMQVVEDRLKMELSDEEADRYFLGLIQLAINAIMPALGEIMHRIAMKIK